MNNVKTIQAQKLRYRTQSVAAYALMTALISVSAFVRIPLPLVPVTMQFAFCTLSALLFGIKGVIPVAIYIFMGLCGLPVFTMGGGITYVLQPTFGYMIGFVIGTAVCGLIARGVRADKPLSIKRLILGAAASLMVVDVIGVVYLYLMMTLYLGEAMTFGAAVVSGVAVFLPTDITWCVLASLLAYKLVPILRRMHRADVVDISDADESVPN